MFKKLVKYFLLLLSLFSTTKIYSEFIILDCSEINNWTDKRDVLYSLQIGTGSKKVIQVFKNNQLQMLIKKLWWSIILIKLKNHQLFPAEGLNKTVINLLFLKLKITITA